MSIVDYVLIFLILIAVTAAMAFIFRKKKSGKCIGCSGCCASCGRICDKR